MIIHPTAGTLTVRVWQETSLMVRLQPQQSKVDSSHQGSQTRGAVSQYGMWLEVARRWHTDMQ